MCYIEFSFIQDKVKAHLNSPYIYEFENSLKLQGWGLNNVAGLINSL